MLFNDGHLIVLYYFVLYYTSVLFCFVFILDCIVLYHVTSNRGGYQWSVFDVLYCVVLYCTVLDLITKWSSGQSRSVG